MRKLLLLFFIIASCARSSSSNSSNDYYVTTFAGSGIAGSTDGTNASFNSPKSIFFYNNILYVADTNNNSIRAIDSNSNVTTLINSGLSSPVALAIDSDIIYILNNTSSKITKYNLQTQAKQDITLIGLSSPGGLAFGNNKLYISDTGNNQIKEYDLASASLKTVAGSTAGSSDGTADAKLNNPRGLFFNNNNLYIADFLNASIRQLNLDGYVMSTLAGAVSSISGPSGVIMVSNGNIFIADTVAQKIKLISSDSVSSVAGTGNFGSIDDVGSKASFINPYSITFQDDNTYYIADIANNKIRKIIYR